MIRKLLFSGLALGTALILSGCGGGSSSATTTTATTDSTTTSTTTSGTTTEDSSDTTIQQGTGHYYDAAVEGVVYTCGTFEGTTDDNGTFTFEIGETCTFTLNGILLRTVAADVLDHDGVIILEDALPVAQLLQTLDNDGNLSNGITISPEVMDFLQNESNITLDGLLDGNSTEVNATIYSLFEELNSSVPGYEGTFVTPEEAAAHLEETRQEIDTTAPDLVLIGDTNMTVALGSTFTDPGYSVTDDFYAVDEINVTVTGIVDTNTLGSYTLIYTAVDGAGNESNVTRTVNVTDQTPPSITITNVDIDVEINSSFTDADALIGVSAIDIVDGDVVVSADISQINLSVLGDYNVTYTATDAAGNSVTAQATVHVLDTTAPVITLNGDNPQTIEVAQGSSYTDPGAVVTDNSGENIAAVVTGTVNTTAVGTYTVTYTATDSSGNWSDVNRTVNVIDTTAPELVLNGDATMTVAMGSTFTDPGVVVTDNSGETLTATVSGSVDTDAVGTYTLTYTATDSASNSNSIERTVIVTDQTPPTITVTNSNIDVEINSSFTSADALVGVSATDNLDTTVDVTADISQVNLAVLGTYTVTYTASDSAGNEATATATVHVIDTTDPVITLNGDNPETVEVAQGSTYTDPGAVVTDNSGENITAVVSGSVDTTAIATYTLTYTATDSSGNESNVTRTVNVVDTTAPEITLIGDNPMTVFVNDTYNEPGAVVTDNSGEEINATITGTVDTSTTGTYEVTYSAADSSGNDINVTRVVNVTNGNPPVITLDGDNPYIVEVNTTYVDPGATATDVEDGTVSVTNDADTVVNMMVLGDYNVTYTATDSQDNTVTATRTVRVVDTTEPVITLNGDNPMSVNQNATFTDPGATVTDNSGETLDVNVTGTVDTSVVGSYTLTYSATDSSGNSASVTRTVEVLDVTPPVITTQGDVTVEVGSNYTAASATAVDEVDGDLSTSITVDDSSVDTSVVGDYNVTYTVSDSANNTATAIITVHVVDTTPPQIVMNGDNPLNILEGDDYTEFGATVTDNYDSNLTATVIYNDVNTSEQGQYSVVYYAVDSSGNEANATRIVNVTLGEAPVITVLGNNPYDVLIDTTYSDPGVSATDAEDGDISASVDMNTSDLNMSELGTYTVTYSVTDSQGNIAYASRTVNVVDSIVLTANSDYVQPTDLSMQTLHVTDNDDVPNGATITNVYLKVWDPNQGVYVYITSFEEREGTWSVIGTDVEFSPASTFGGGTVTIEYQIVDDNNDTSENWITIEYPEVLKANDDYNSSATIEPYSVDVLANDIYSDATNVVISLVEYIDENNEPVTATAVQRGEGNWTVSNGQLLFTPDDYFGGGNAGVNYMIEEDGMRSMGWVNIDFPVFVRAEYDHADMNDTALGITYDVMNNDQNSSPAEVYLLDYSNGATPAEVKTMTDNNGDWVVEDNQSVTFTPNSDFSGGSVHVDYILTDGTYSSRTGFDIQYPVYLQAEYDRVEGLTDLVPVNIDVLNNDTLPGDYSSVTLLVQGPWDDQTQQNTYTTTYTDNRGTWQVESNQTITFTPSSTFGGGNIWWSYKILDNNGHESETGMEIVYPLFVEAQYDEYTADAIETVTYDVLGNDNIGTGITPEILFIDFSNGGSYVSTLTEGSGTWSVDGNNQVVFTPDADFSGGDVHVEYVITDNDGHYSQTGFTIHYPVGPTPVCTVETLTSVEEVYTKLLDGLSDDEGDRWEFGTEIDKDAYLIAPELYADSTPVTGLNPMYFVRYEEHSWTTWAGDNFEEAELTTTIVPFNSADSTWYYEDNKTGNDRGYKYVATDGESGTYTVDSDDATVLNVDGADVFSFKVVREINTSEINNALENAGINLTLDSADTAHMHLTKELMDSYDWWGPFDDNSYSDFDAFIQAFTYDSSASDAYGNELVHSNITWEKGLLFAEGSAGNTSGTLVEVYRRENTLLVDNAGTWEIRTIDDEGTQYQIIDIRPTLCGYEKKIYKLDDTTIIQGQIDQEADVVGAELAFSESLKNKLADFFIANAPLNINPEDPTNPEITDAMLDGKIFYTERVDADTGLTYYKRITADIDAHQIRKEDFTVDSDGNVVASSDEMLDYEIDDGRIRIQGEGDVKIGLNEIDSDGNWDVTIYTWDGLSDELWLIDEPANFPS